MDKKNFEKDIDVPSKRLDRIDKMEIDLANYEQMERDIEKIIEPYQLNWELDCLSLPTAIQSILERKEQEYEELKRYKSLFEKARDLWNEASKTNYKLLDEIEDLKDSLKRTICQSECYKHKEAEKLKQTLAEIKFWVRELLKRTGQVVPNEIKEILREISECEGNDD